MKSIYANVSPVTGGHKGGVKQIKIVPIEWLASEIIVDFATGKVTSDVELIEGKDWLTVDLTADSYDFSENSKSNKGGTYYETSVAGTSNDMNPDVYQLLETLRFHQFVAIVIDRQQRSRIIGNIYAGMTMQVSNENKNNQGGTLTVSLQLYMQADAMAPFYDGTTEAGGSLCDGIENFTDVNWTLFHAPPIPDYYYLLFSGGNTSGSVQLEVYNIDGDGVKIDASFNSFTMEPGSYNGPSFTHGVFVEDYNISDTTIVRWRKVCTGGAYTAWAQKQLDGLVI